jgi:hypothetical protein
MKLWCSASRTPERVLESPVTIRKNGIADVKVYFTTFMILENLKVQMNTSSLSFKSINSGFATLANTVCELVDGMDNSYSLLNFVLGNLIGILRNDVQSVDYYLGHLLLCMVQMPLIFVYEQQPILLARITAYNLVRQVKSGGIKRYVDYGIR